MKALFPFFASPRLCNLLLVVEVLLLALATFVEKSGGASLARALVYNNPLFYLLLLLSVVNFVAVVIKGGYWQAKKGGMLLLHGAFLFILAGAWVTHRFGFEGSIHLREGAKTDQMLSLDKSIVYEITTSQGTVAGSEPFEVPLWRSGFQTKIPVGGEFLEIRQMGEIVSLDGGTQAVRLLLRKGEEQRVVVPYGLVSEVSDSVPFAFSDLQGWIRYGKSWQKLPFEVALTDFRLERYPGSRSPSSYESDLIITNIDGSRQEAAYMNRVVLEGGYRLYQSSYDMDEQGTILSVNYDPWGMALSYGGYFLLGIGILWILLGKGSRFRELNRELKRLSLRADKGGLLLLIGLLFVPISLRANPGQIEKYLPAEAHAQQMGRLPVQSPEGRIEPFDTYARTLLRKLSRSDTYQGAEAVQVLLGIQAFPSIWAQLPLLRQSNEELHAILGTSGGTSVAFRELFTLDGSYKLAALVEKAYRQPTNKRSKLEKEILKLDERVNIFYALQQGRMLPLFPLPSDPNGRWYSRGDQLTDFPAEDSLFVSLIFDWYLQEMAAGVSSDNYQAADSVAQMITSYQQVRANELPDASKIEAELCYNRLSVFDFCAKGYLTIGLILLWIVVVASFSAKRCWRVVSRIALGGIVLLFAYHCFGIGLRWYISGQAPWSNSYESMVYVGWAAVLAGLLFIRRSQLTVALATFLGGLILLVAHLNWMDPQITPLVPVLKSYWLMIHVAVITASYGFFGMSFLLGITSLVFTGMESYGFGGDWKLRQRELRLINELSLTIGLCLMTAGTFLGAIWANESWGRYWGWDPKETWALITLLVYALVLHARFTPPLRSDFSFALLSIYALLSVLMTYFGVNYYLSGLHAYGNNETPPAVGAILVFYLLITGAAIWIYYRRKYALK